MSRKVGKDAKVSIGTVTISEMCNWSIDGISTDEFDASAFGDTWKEFEYGMKDGGTVSFSGHYDPEDTAGQLALQKANLYNSALTNLRLYIDSVNYYTPCQYAGYFSPDLTSGASTRVSNVRITSLSISADKSSLESIKFTGRVSGTMVLVTLSFVTNDGSFVTHNEEKIMA